MCQLTPYILWPFYRGRTRNIWATENFLWLKVYTSAMCQPWARHQDTRDQSELSPCPQEASSQEGKHTRMNCTVSAVGDVRTPWDRDQRGSHSWGAETRGEATCGGAGKAPLKRSHWCWNLKDKTATGKEPGKFPEGGNWKDKGPEWQVPRFHGSQCLYICDYFIWKTQ